MTWVLLVFCVWCAWSMVTISARINRALDELETRFEELNDRLGGDTLDDDDFGA